MEKGAHDFVSRVRDQRTIEEMDHIRECISMLHEELLWKRRKKAEILMERKGVIMEQQDYETLKTTKYNEQKICQSHGLRNGHSFQETESLAPENVRSISERPQYTEDGRRVGHSVSDNVVNLSRRILSQAEVALLSKGLTFSPIPSELDKTKLKGDIEIVKRRMRLKWFFRDESDSKDPSTTYKFKCKSSWSPSVTDTLLDSYLTVLENELLAIPVEGKSYSNLSQPEISALGCLNQDRNVVIKGADKGSAVVVWDRCDYILEANRQLSDSQVYEEVDKDSVVDACNSIERRLQELLVDDPSLEGVVQYYSGWGSKVGRFYLLPKIHKGINGVKGKPVISNCATCTEHISEYLDHHLTPLTQHGKSYIKDTNHFLLKLGGYGIFQRGLYCVLWMSLVSILAYHVGRD